MRKMCESFADATWGCGSWMGTGKLNAHKGGGGGFAAVTSLIFRFGFGGEAARGIENTDMLRWICVALLLLLPAAGVAADGDVRLASLGLYRTHEWLGQPTVYFQCHGEPKVYLPDVIQKDFVYDFVGQESWQPLTFLVGAKCKRCGFYEEDKLKYDDRFDEWELCPTEFTLEPDGRYIHFNKDEFNATFVCPGCSNPQQWMYESEDGDQYDPPLVKHKSYFLLIVLVLAAAILIVAAVAFLAYGYWQHKQHQAHQAWFMELFEDDESLQADLGLKEDL